MSNDTFDSSDSFRSAKPLKFGRTATFKEPLELTLGGRLPEFTVAYETYGELNAARDNAVLVCHALSGDSHVAQHSPDDDPGWWDVLIGPGKCIDTDRYFVVCQNVLGGCRGTTGPNSINPETGHRYGTDFPMITVGDIVKVQHRLIEHLGIQKLRATVGGSLGGHQAMTWSTLYPDQVGGVVAIATSARLTSQALAFDVVGRNAILCDPDYLGGDYYEKGPGPLVGLAIARMLGHITYLSREAMMQKFDAQRLQPRDIQTQFETKFSVGSYLAYQGDRFGERFDPNSYLTLTMAIDLFDLGETKEALTKTLSASKCRWLLMSFSSDWLFPPFQSKQIVDALIAAGKEVSYCDIATDCGHDAFLLTNQLHIYGEMTRAFLANLGRDTSVPEEKKATSAAVESVDLGEKKEKSPEYKATSIFHHDRLDYDSLLELIPPGASVLDLGCGSGGLLARLRERGHQNILGVELDEEAILGAMRRGFNVIQADLNKGLPAFAHNQFDVVVLSQTLQTVLDVPRIISDMLRVGRRAIVSFPNVAFHEHRRQLAEKGIAPHGFGLQDFRWYDTPNVRFCSISDFEQLCKEQGYKIEQQIALDIDARRQVTTAPNLNADVAIVVLGR